MSKKWITIIVALVAVVGFWMTQKSFKKTDDNEKNQIAKVEGKFYWTCPMHPQIHSEHPGECPICHMKLVKVSEQIDATKSQSDSTEKRSAVQATTSQLELIGIQKQEVEKMTLTAVIPVSGRLLSASSVAFQVYETDLRYVRPGLGFKGEDSFYSGEEISGTISSVDSIVDPTSRTVRVVGTIHKGPRGLISETSFRGEIRIELKDKLAIPESAVLHTGQGDLVYLVGDGNKLTPKKVSVGLKTEGFYEVLSGLNAGDFISSGPNFLIDSEAKIRGTSDPASNGSTTSKPTCPDGQHWDIPMSMCMPGKDSK
jgi:hypothetical protein